MSFLLLNANALHLPLSDESVHVVCTSVPYYGLRSYETDPQVWSGRADCSHAWGEPCIQKRGGGGERCYGSYDGALARGPAPSLPVSSTCTLCGAWRGELGLEPTIDLFIDHMVMIFREVKRVLRKDGVLWLNCGSTYAAAPNGRSAEETKSSGRDNRTFRDKPIATSGRHGTGDPLALQGYVGIQRANACGTDGKEPEGYRVTGSSCSDLCDECLTSWSLYIQNIDQQPQQSGSPPLQTTHDTVIPGSSEVTSGAGPHAVRGSTTLESWLQSRGECLRCERRASLSRMWLPSSFPGVPVCADKGECIGDNAKRRLVPRSQGKDVSDLAYPYFTMASQFKPKDLIGVPWILALALQADGWWVRSDCIFSKINPLPSSVRDRPAMSHEYMFMLTKASKYYYDSIAVRQPATWGRRIHKAANKQKYDGSNFIRPGGGEHTLYSMKTAGCDPSQGRNLRSVWSLSTQPLRSKKFGSDVEHFAAMPEKLVEPCILSGPERVCAKCGAPYTRVTKPSEQYAQHFGSNNGANTDPYGKGYRKHSSKVCAEYDTVNWKATCTCGVTETVGATILDPFAGSGTVGVVALRHSRQFVGVDLKREYLDLARARIEHSLQPARPKRPRREKVLQDEQLVLEMPNV